MQLLTQGVLRLFTTHATKKSAHPVTCVWESHPNGHVVSKGNQKELISTISPQDESSSAALLGLRPHSRDWTGWSSSADIKGVGKLLALVGRGGEDICFSKRGHMRKQTCRTPHKSTQAPNTWLHPILRVPDCQAIPMQILLPLSVDFEVHLQLPVSQEAWLE